MQRSRNTAPSPVSETLRVVRCSKRTPNLSSRRSTLLPTADLDRPIRSAAAVKLFASAT